MIIEFFERLWSFLLVSLRHEDKVYKSNNKTVEISFSTFSYIGKRRDSGQFCRFE